MAVLATVTALTSPTACVPPDLLNHTHTMATTANVSPVRLRTAGGLLLLSDEPAGAGRAPSARLKKELAIKTAQQEVEGLLQELHRLEAEQRVLRRTEESLLHVLDSLDVMCRAASCFNSSSQQELRFDLNDHLAAALVQQQETDIAALLARFGFCSSTGSSSSTTTTSSGGQVKRVNAVLKHAAKAGSMTAAQVTPRLAELAARLALQVIAHEAQHEADAHAAQPCGELVSNVDEYLTLMVAALLWGGPAYPAIVNTNLETQQPFSEPLPAQRWLAAMKRVQMTDAQSEAVTTLFAYAHRRMEPVRSNFSQAVLQQAAATQWLEQALLQHKQRGQPAAAAGASGHRAAAADGSAPGAAAAGGPAATGPEVVAGAGFAAKHAEQQLLLQDLVKRLRLQGLHVGIALTHILSPFQMAVLISDAFPSIPYMGQAVAAWNEHVAQQKQSQQE